MYCFSIDAYQLNTYSAWTWWRWNLLISKCLLVSSIRSRTPTITIPSSHQLDWRTTIWVIGLSPTHFDGFIYIWLDGRSLRHRICITTWPILTCSQNWPFQRKISQLLVMNGVLCRSRHKHLHMVMIVTFANCWDESGIICIFCYSESGNFFGSRTCEFFSFWLVYLAWWYVLVRLRFKSIHLSLMKLQVSKCLGLIGGKILRH